MALSMAGWVLPLIGVIYFMIKLVPGHHWTRHTERAHKWFYHKSERGEVDSDQVSTDSHSSLLDQVKPKNWDDSIYERKDPTDDGHH